MNTSLVERIEALGYSIISNKEKELPRLFEDFNLWRDKNYSEKHDTTKAYSIDVERELLLTFLAEKETE